MTKSTAPKGKTAPAAKKAPASKAPATAKVFSLADLARDLKIDPKVARAKARRNEDDFGKYRARGEEGWVFPTTKRADVSRLLTGAAAA